MTAPAPHDQPHDQPHDRPRQDPPEIGGAAVLAFAAELALVVLLAVAGWRLGPGLGGPAGVATSVVLLLALPAAAVMVWSRWMAPRSTHRLPQPRRLSAQVVLFVVAGAAAAAAGLTWWGLGVAVVGVVAFTLTRRD